MHGYESPGATSRHGLRAMGRGDRRDRAVAAIAGLPQSPGARRARWFYGQTGGCRHVTFAAGSRDARRLVVFAVNGVNPYAMEALVGRYLDRSSCET